MKDIEAHIIDAAATYKSRDPPGVKGSGAIAWGGGAVLRKENEALLREVDPRQFVA